MKGTPAAKQLYSNPVDMRDILTKNMPLYRVYSKALVVSNKGVKSDQNHHKNIQKSVDYGHVNSKNISPAALLPYIDTRTYHAIEVPRSGAE